MTVFAIFPNPDIEGGVAVLIPTGVMPVEEAARRDLPPGTPFKLISQSEIPSDDYFFKAWEADFTHPDGVAIGIEKWTAQHPHYFDKL